MAEIMNIGQGEHFGKLFSQAHLHLVFDGINSILRQAARFDIAIKNDHLVSGQRQLLRGEQTGGSCAHNENSRHKCVVSKLHQPQGEVSGIRVARLG